MFGATGGHVKETDLSPSQWYVIHLCTLLLRLAFFPSITLAKPTVSVHVYSVWYFEVLSARHLSNKLALKRQGLWLCIYPLNARLYKGHKSPL